jgi:hypothetical protein
MDIISLDLKDVIKVEVNLMNLIFLVLRVKVVDFFEMLFNYSTHQHSWQLFTQFIEKHPSG